jgi:hypothetical protein
MVVASFLGTRCHGKNGGSSPNGMAHAWSDENWEKHAEDQFVQKWTNWHA